MDKRAVYVMYTLIFLLHSSLYKFCISYTYNVNLQKKHIIASILQLVPIMAIKMHTAIPMPSINFVLNARSVFSTSSGSFLGSNIAS